MRGRRRKSKAQLFRWRRMRVRTLEKEGFTFREAEWISGLQVPLNPRPTGKNRQSSSVLAVSTLILTWRRRRAADIRTLRDKRQTPLKIESFFENNEDDSIDLMRDEYATQLEGIDERYIEFAVA